VGVESLFKTQTARLQESRAVLLFSSLRGGPGASPVFYLESRPSDGGADAAIQFWIATATSWPRDDGKNVVPLFFFRHARRRPSIHEFFAGLNKNSWMVGPSPTMTQWIEPWPIYTITVPT
jgi:hypothetical protein